jgi:hypothetical protein
MTCARSQVLSVFDADAFLCKQTARKFRTVLRIPSTLSPSNGEVGAGMKPARLSSFVKAPRRRELHSKDCELSTRHLKSSSANSCNSVLRSLSKSSIFSRRFLSIWASVDQCIILNCCYGEPTNYCGCDW